mmetsp:Transcript_42870/g.121497  ORF Transcript_42870/g.121497 Transcript_42870/m.121497 type:complete len:119 (+) Transcript_42870:78-434(+)
MQGTSTYTPAHTHTQRESRQVKVTKLTRTHIHTHIHTHTGRHNRTNRPSVRKPRREKRRGEEGQDMQVGNVREGKSGQQPHHTTQLAKATKEKRVSTHRRAPSARHATNNPWLCVCES